VNLHQPGARMLLKVTQTRRQVRAHGVRDSLHKVTGSHRRLLEDDFESF
jgi:hypothetical protein